MRGAILAHFGWTYRYLLWGISWRNVRLMMADAPGYEYEKDGKSEEGKNVRVDSMNELDAELKKIGW